MPLPKPPAKRADMLTEEDIRNLPKAVRKTAQATPPSSLPVAAPITPAPSAALPPVLELVKPARTTTASASEPVAKVPVIEARTPETSSRPAPVGKGRATTTAAGKGRRKPVDSGPPRLFVLDTNVLLHDPMSLFRFAEHDIYLPMITLEDGSNVFNALSFAEDSAESQQIKEDTHARLRELIQTLPQAQREVLMMRHYADMSFQEIADSTGVSINTALGRMRYALINLRKLIEENAISM